MELCCVGGGGIVMLSVTTSVCRPAAAIVLQGAEGTAYEGCTFRLSLKFTSEYPFKAPTVRFETACFHPNVDTFGNICLDILKEKWSGQSLHACSTVRPWC